MEELDRRLVGLLLADGRMSYTDLGKATGLSTSAVHQRVRRLEERGVITGYAATVSPEALGLSLTALISVTPFDPSAPCSSTPRRSTSAPSSGCPRSSGRAACRRTRCAASST
jgi:Lrp/AsnC family leucine-responsive transcriptional regulator